MAKANKFTSINFNHIYEKNLSTNSKPSSNSNPNNTPLNNPSSSSSSSSSSSASFSYSAISSPHSKTHGRMLVLTRPTPKPISAPPPQPQPQLQSSPQQTQQLPDQIRSDPPSDAISLRPLGRTGSSPPILSPVPIQATDKEAACLVSSPKPDKFVPPHLRPGFVAKEVRPRPVHKPFGPPGRCGEDGRPKSGGGHERMMKGADSDFGIMNRPRSSGNLPSSSG